MLFERSLTLFCTYLEVVILEVEIQRSFFGRIQDTINCFRDLLTFRIQIGKKILGFRNMQEKLEKKAICNVWYFFYHGNGFLLAKTVAVA